MPSSITEGINPHALLARANEHTLEMYELRRRALVLLIHSPLIEAVARMRWIGLDALVRMLPNGYALRCWPYDRSARKLSNDVCGWCS